MTEAGEPIHRAPHARRPEYYPPTPEPRDATTLADGFYFYRRPDWPRPVVLEVDGNAFGMGGQAFFRLDPGELYGPVDPPAGIFDATSACPGAANGEGCHPGDPDCDHAEEDPLTGRVEAQPEVAAARRRGDVAESERAAMLREAAETPHAASATAGAPAPEWMRWWPAMAADLTQRFDRGYREYGDGVFARRPVDLVREQLEEVLDVAGWGLILYARLRRLQDAVATRPLAVVFDGPPSAAGPGFVEVERGGRSVRVGEWRERPDGLWELRLGGEDF